jgi:PAS domain-containing protein
MQIGPVDSSCAFAVVDARRWDQPLVFVSDTFVKMTGYTNEEIIGRNCRFLQTPGGGTVQGAPRKYTDGNAAVSFQGGRLATNEHVLTFSRARSGTCDSTSRLARRASRV